MENQKFFDLFLPKWPALLVKGTSVTPEQAKEIIIRTDSLRFSTNDRIFEKQLNNVLYNYYTRTYDSELISKPDDDRLGIDISEKEKAFSNVWEYRNKCLAKYHLLDIEYLHNTRIVSCWVGGVKGWCNWDGTIETSNYNIGKYPSIQEVYNEWKIIAKVFPYLELQSQLLDGENCEDYIKPVIQFNIKKGKVKMIIPKEQLIPITDYEFRDLTNPFNERGCTINEFSEALELVENKFK